MKELSHTIYEWKQHPQTSFRIIAFGSSNTELSWHSGGRHNWVDWLNLNIRTHIGKHVCVINQGICGEHTEDLLARIDRDVFSFSPSIVIITIGGNDAVHKFTPEQYTENLKKLCLLLLEKGIQPVLQTYYCPVYHEGIEGYQPLFESFVQANRAIAEELGLPLIDQYRYFAPYYKKCPAEYGKLMRDWLHVTPLGNLIMGIHASRAFGLPDFEIPEDVKYEVQTIMRKMDDLQKISI